jgi:hypothetical protein
MAGDGGVAEKRRVVDTSGIEPDTSRMLSERDKPTTPCALEGPPDSKYYGALGKRNSKTCANWASSPTPDYYLGVLHGFFLFGKE